MVHVARYRRNKIIDIPANIKIIPPFRIFLVRGRRRPGAKKSANFRGQVAMTVPTIAIARPVKKIVIYPPKRTLPGGQYSEYSKFILFVEPYFFSAFFRASASSASISIVISILSSTVSPPLSQLIPKSCLFRVV